MMKHPIQPIEPDKIGVLRFKQNKIVRHLLDTHPNCNLNTIASMGPDFDDEDRRQLAQLIGYSVSGYGTLSYVRDEDYAAAAHMHDTGSDEKDARIAALEQTIAELRQKVRALREPFEEVFDFAGDD
jgi:hypothetical protein